jgi:hypothetical protein
VGALGRWLASNAEHREPAKLGLTLLAGGDESDLPLLDLFAGHEEFTKYAAFAAGEILREDVIDWWMAVAKRLDGWGKIDLVNRIAETGDERVDVRDWLLRHGCANHVGYEFLAYTCATAGRLHEAIAAEQVDDELLDGMAIIVEGLVRDDGGAADIDHYEHGQKVILHLLRHMAARPTFARQHTAMLIAQWTSDDEVRRRCRAILGHATAEELRARVHGTHFDLYRAWGLGRFLGVDVWDEIFDELRAHPLDQNWYHFAATTDDPARFRRVVAFAEEQLPLEEIASGAALEMGIGPGFAAHGCLDMVVQRMRDVDGFSEPLVIASLRSPVTRNRNMALNALEARDPGNISETVREAVRAAAAVEPNADTRARLATLAAKFA